jgi:protocatechuate 3,4-dioxygenase beta subunit
MNVGVVTANADGVATLHIRHPQPYRVPFKGRLEPHIHFRICSDSGIMSRIKTVFLSDGHVEGFLSN